MDNTSLSIQIIAGGIAVIAADDSRVEFIFPDAPPEFLIGASGGAIAFWVQEGVRATAYADGPSVHVVLSRDDLTPRSIPVLFNPADATLLDGALSTGLFRSEVTDGAWSFVQESGGVLMMPSTEMRLEFTQFSPVFALSSTASYYSVAAGQRPPTFSVALYDDAAYTRQRPIRLGVPIVSTVPVYGTNLTADEQTYFSSGQGAKSRTMYIQIVCNKILPVGITPELQLSLPNGLDTVSLPINLPLLTVYPVTPSGQSVYRTSYTFFAEDTVNNVDGFAYASVYIPLSVQAGLPMRLQVSSGGSYTPLNTLPTMFSVETL